MLRDVTGNTVMLTMGIRQKAVMTKHEKLIFSSLGLNESTKGTKNKVNLCSSKRSRECPKIPLKISWKFIWLLTLAFSSILCVLDQHQPMANPEIMPSPGPWHLGTHSQGWA